MISLTPKQRAAWVYIAAYISTHGIAPSFAEMQEGLGLSSKGCVFRVLRHLVERGAVRRIAGRTRAIEVVSWPDEVPRPGSAEVRLARMSDDALRDLSRAVFAEQFKRLVARADARADLFAGRK